MKNEKGIASKYLSSYYCADQRLENDKKNLQYVRFKIDGFLIPLAKPFKRKSKPLNKRYV